MFSRWGQLKLGSVPLLFRNYRGSRLQNTDIYAKIQFSADCRRDHHTLISYSFLGGYTRLKEPLRMLLCIFLIYKIDVSVVRRSYFPLLILIVVQTM